MKENLVNWSYCVKNHSLICTSVYRHENGLKRADGSCSTITHMHTHCLWQHAACERLRVLPVGPFVQHIQQLIAGSWVLFEGTQCGKYSNANIHHQPLPDATTNHARLAVCGAADHMCIVSCCEHTRTVKEPRTSASIGASAAQHEL